MTIEAECNQNPGPHALEVIIGNLWSFPSPTPNLEPVEPV